MTAGINPTRDTSYFKKAYLIIDSEISRTISSHGLFTLRPFLNDLNNHDQLLERIWQKKLILMRIGLPFRAPSHLRRKEFNSGNSIRLAAVITSIAEKPDPILNIRLYLEEGARQGKRILLHRKMAEDLGLHNESWVTNLPLDIPEEFLLLRERGKENAQQ